jgi:hypothetical protein
MLHDHIIVVVVDTPAEPYCAYMRIVLLCAALN